MNRKGNPQSNRRQLSPFCLADFAGKNKIKGGKKPTRPPVYFCDHELYRGSLLRLSDDVLMGRNDGTF